MVVLAALVAATFPPAVVVPRAVDVARDLGRAWFYFCSMMIGAAPFLAAGALAAAAAVRTRFALPLFAMLFPGCDCSMNAYASSLRQARPAVSAFAIVWGSCCNPLALFSTATILGPRMLLYRILTGAIAAAFTAAAWSRIQPSRDSDACQESHGFWRSFVNLSGNGVASFGIAAGVSAIFLTLHAFSIHAAGAVTAGILGALLSPCSSVDALLARVLFSTPATQLAFIVAAQCLDVRQISLVYRFFGGRCAASAFGAAIAACVAGSALAHP
jgi:uncharacterized membrane protein YraQ (UPF0718 family)